MSDSFYTIRKDKDFALASAAFKTKIVATPLLYGLTAGLATSYATLDGTFQSALIVATDPATRTKAKVNAKDQARKAVKQNAAVLASIINGTPTVTDEQKIDLGIGVRATPTPMPPLGQPSHFTCEIELATGALNLKWKNTNPKGATGATYQIWRRIGATGEFTYLGGSGEKKFTDSDVPAGSAQVQYKIQAVRSTSVGPFAQFIVNFGAGGSTTVTESTPVRIAA